MEQLQVMEKELTIQQMAQATGLSANTLRYYERAGLMMQHVERDEANGYRSYSHQHVAWIEFLKRLRATGMPIRDIQRYTERLQLLKQHQSRVEEHLREVEHHLEAITSKIAYYEQQFTQHQPVSYGESLPSCNDE